MSRQPPYCERCGKYPCSAEEEQECKDNLINYEDDIKEDLRNEKMEA